MTTKILDATTISVGLGDLKALDLIPRCAAVYPMVTTKEVRQEVERGFSSRSVEEAFSKIGLSSPRPPESEALLDYLRARFPFLHDGELTSFVLALSNYELEGEPYYYVTDDRAMRRSIGRILSSDMVRSLAGRNISGFRSTGTIGLMIRLLERGCLSKEDAERAVEELKDSTFRVTGQLLHELRRAADEA